MPANDPNPLVISSILCYFYLTGNGQMPAKQKTIDVVEDEQGAVDKALGA
jgi:hypothetical protein